MIQQIVNAGEILFWVPIAVLIMTAIGLIWALPAAVICRFVADSRALDGSSFGGPGARYSALLVLPWISFLVKLIVGKSPFPVFAVVAVYVLLYLVWLITIVLILLGLVTYVVDVVAGSTSSFGTTVFSIVLLAVVLLLSTLSWTTSLKDMSRLKKISNHAVDDGSKSLLEDAYLQPFGWLIAWSFVTVVAVGLTGLLGFVGT